jgi:hypothetical protein
MLWYEYCRLGASELRPFFRRFQGPHLKTPNPGFNQGFTSRIYYIKCEVEPLVKPEVWRPEIWALFNKNDAVPVLYTMASQNVDCSEKIIFINNSRITENPPSARPTSIWIL